tara:strand:+ start:483 stop:1166 length:684 start_codon:yes stop_codon:yes gene_type:complete
MIEYNKKLETLIDLALLDAKISEKERKILIKKAQSFNIDLDEFEIVLEARLLRRKEDIKTRDRYSKMSFLFKLIALLLITFFIVKLILSGSAGWGIYPIVIITVIIAGIILSSSKNQILIDPVNIREGDGLNQQNISIQKEKTNNASLTGLIIDKIANAAKWLVNKNTHYKNKALVESEEFASVGKSFGMNKDEWKEKSNEWIEKDPVRFAEILSYDLRDRRISKYF